MRASGRVSRSGPSIMRSNFAFTGYYQENGNAYVANTPAQSVPSNIYNPSPLPVVTGARLPPRKANEVTLRSFAIADTMSFLNETVLFTVGARHQRVEQDAFSTTTGAQTSSYGAEAVTPLAGLVVKPLQNVSLYANYAEGLSQGIIVPANFANRGEILAPYKSKQQEAGIKVDWGTITTTAAVFQIARPLLITTPANFRVYDGEQQNRGLELNAYGLLLPGLRGMVSATFLRPEITKSSTLAEIGKDAAGVPDKTFSASLDWDTPWVSGLSLNGRVIYTSGSYLTNLNNPWQKFSDWTRFDIGARYATVLQRTAGHVPRQHREPFRQQILAHDRFVRDRRLAADLPRCLRRSISKRQRKVVPPAGYLPMLTNVREIAGTRAPALSV